MVNAHWFKEFLRTFILPHSRHDKRPWFWSQPSVDCSKQRDLVLRCFSAAKIRWLHAPPDTLHSKAGIQWLFSRPGLAVPASIWCLSFLSVKESRDQTTRGLAWKAVPLCLCESSPAQLQKVAWTAWRQPSTKMQASWNWWFICNHPFQSCVQCAHLSFPAGNYLRKDSNAWKHLPILPRRPDKW